MVMISSDEGMERAEKWEEKRKKRDIDGPLEVVRWEKYLPKMVLRVLLVEADDSTRQIISALLRKCGYRVVAVPDGLMAWETLKGQPQNIDLILTELDLPSISGFALLTLVMEHEAFRNIPVIMMSLQNSISTVLKCMLKGAADFLIKPVRKNELKNLWQHVWRRHTSLPASQPKLEATADNNAASNHSKDYASSAHKNGSDNTQSSCSTLYMEDENGYMQKQGTSNFSNAGPRKLMESDRSDKKSAIPWTGTEGRENHSYLFVSEKFHSWRMDENQAHDEAMPLVNKKVETSDVTMDLIGSFDNRSEYFYRHNSSNEDVAPELELSLRRFCPGISRNQVDDERQKPCLSYASAFSWYNSSKSLQAIFPAVGSNPTEPKTPNESHEVFKQLSGDTFVNSDLQGATTSSNQENITSCVSGQSGQFELTYQSPQPDTTFQPMCIPQTHGWRSNQTQQQEDPLFPSNNSVNSNLDIRQSEETVNCSIESNSVKAGKEQELGSPVAGQSTCTNLCSEGMVSHDNSTAHGGTAMENLKGENFFSDDGFRGMDSHRSSQREAALTKFRLKRKDRCFEKKVRYQSRKKLAEQRPRVKGQFVRALQSESPATDASVGP